MSDQMRTWKVWIRTSTGAQILVPLMADSNPFRALEMAKAMYGPSLLSSHVIPA